MSSVELVCRGVIGFVMALAIIGKVSGHERWREFRASLAGFTWLPYQARTAVAALVVAAEAAVLVLVAVPATAVAGLALGGLLLTGISLAVLAARRAGHEVRCNCFGGDAGPIGRAELIRNAILVLICALGATASTAAAATPGPVAGGLLLSCAALAAAALSFPRELRFALTHPRRDLP
ncbi:MauE/DoxX family redox-associated membrane protein [Catenuloplanes atrovinosus]|uniref:Methylamine utilisation protein MauE domain-containing protein n=1 Tax=Catenuloplanes atrovinosus TaxID=137266 RepID=A0AAE4CAI0_9ACTN|nr:MauE/DoxX family redox-associated membrane protein [Catenuloplanes atrovinosus]MDR7277078.1 hypothetical protein [Catenuloplanes atrovinosus]